MQFLYRKHFIISSILFLIFILLTKILPYFLISQKIIYDKKGITMKAEAMAEMLSWPLSSLFSTSFLNSYYFLPFLFIYYLLLLIVFVWLHNFLWSRRLYRWLCLACIVFLITLRINPNLLIYLDNEQASKSIGTSGDGSLINGKRLIFKGENFQYFNFLSYLKGNCFVHEKVKKTLLDAYSTCEKTCPKIEFLIGEGSKKKWRPVHI